MKPKKDMNPKKILVTKGMRIWRPIRNKLMQKSGKVAR